MIFKSGNIQEYLMQVLIQLVWWSHNVMPHIPIAYECAATFNIQTTARVRFFKECPTL